MSTRARPSATNGSDATLSLGPRLRAVRLRHGVGLRELARRLDLSASAISRIKTGKMHPSVRTLYAFASELKVTVDEVLSDRLPPPDAGASSSTPHRLSNDGDEAVRAIWVVRGRRGSGAS
jgi:transcriptional regulator with XRE-family HTH domain